MFVTTAVAAAAFGAADASAAEQHAYAVGMNYATATITMGQGDTLTFTNLDSIAKHDLRDHDGRFASDPWGAGSQAPCAASRSSSPVPISSTARSTRGCRASSR